MIPLNREIAGLLPGLRRYAHALTGNRMSGDRYVRITLETLAEEPWRIRAGRDVRFHLYKLFNDVLSIFAPDSDDDTIDQADPYHRLKHRVLDLPLTSRKLLLLVTVERFPLHRAAELLDMPTLEAEAYLADARDRLCSLVAEGAARVRISQEQAA